MLITQPNLIQGCSNGLLAVRSIFVGVRAAAQGHNLMHRPRGLAGHLL